MRASLVISSRNEGENLARTVQSCLESADGLDYEVVVADDASTDSSVETVRTRFPGIRVAAHAEQRGVSLTKDLGARCAEGDVLVFLDGHCNPEPGTVARLVEDVEALDGTAIVSPRVAMLDVETWRNDRNQVGHGFRIDLDTFQVSWLATDALRPFHHPRLASLYHQPTLCGCVAAMSRSLYQAVWGFDTGMQVYGSEDVDFGVKTWLMGYQVLFDAGPVIGHRFRSPTPEGDMPGAHMLANQLRMARKNFTDPVWLDWLARNSVRHPDWLWESAWDVFLTGYESLERERAHLMAHRRFDEFWYASRFDCAWPTVPRSTAAMSPSHPAGTSPAPVVPLASDPGTPTARPVPIGASLGTPTFASQPSSWSTPTPWPTRALSAVADVFAAITYPGTPTPPPDRGIMHAAITYPGTPTPPPDRGIPSPFPLPHTPTPPPDFRKLHHHHHHHHHHEEYRDVPPKGERVDDPACDVPGETPREARGRGAAARTLVAITSYGNHRTDWLHHLIDTYRNMSYGIDVVVFSDAPKPLPRGVGQVVGMPDENPYSLAFAHKTLFASERDNYDFFLYTEDDILVTEGNLDAFREATAYLGDREVAGFLRYELDPTGDRRFVDAHPPYDWVDHATRRAGPYVFSTFSNDHSGCYLLTRAQLRRAIDSGRYLVAPHQSRYGIRESAATDPYTLCGLTKRVCLSHLDRFLVRHLVPNAAGILGQDEFAFRRQVGALLAGVG